MVAMQDEGNALAPCAGFFNNPDGSRLGAFTCAAGYLFSRAFYVGFLYAEIILEPLDP